MTGSRLVGVALIFVVVSAAWAVLSGAMYSRTTQSESALRSRVEGLWGGPHAQVAPAVTASPPGQTGSETAVPLTLDSSAIDVDIRDDFRQKGLLWYRTYEVEFDGQYEVVNTADVARLITATFAFPAQQATYDAFEFSIAGRRADVSGAASQGLTVSAKAEPGATVPIRLHYRSRGLNTWRYRFGANTVQVKDCTLTAHTSFAKVDFADNTLAPSQKVRQGDGWELRWEFESLVTSLDIAIEMPERLNPGPWATRVSAFAPIGLFFFLALLVIVGVLNGHNLHPMQYAFVCAAFFAFHLLLAYLVDHVDTDAAFAISAACSVVLVVSYLIRAVGARFTFLVAAPAQLIFLVLFSYSFFYPGYTGLSITVGAILTLAIMMHLTAKVDWDAKLRGATPENGLPDRSLPSRLVDARARDLNQHPIPREAEDRPQNDGADPG